MKTYKHKTQCTRNAQLKYYMVVILSTFILINLTWNAETALSSEHETD